MPFNLASTAICQKTNAFPLRIQNGCDNVAVAPPVTGADCDRVEYTIIRFSIRLMLSQPSAQSQHVSQHKDDDGDIRNANTCRRYLPVQVSG